MDKPAKLEVESPAGLLQEKKVKAADTVTTRQPRYVVIGTPLSSKKATKQAEASEQSKDEHSGTLSDVRILPHQVKPEEVVTVDTMRPGTVDEYPTSPRKDLKKMALQIRQARGLSPKKVSPEKEPREDSSAEDQ